MIIMNNNELKFNYSFNYYNIINNNFNLFWNSLLNLFIIIIIII